jgi:Tfp pilus assembly protein PilX
MPQKRQIVKATTKIFNKLGKQLFSAIKRQLVWLLRTFFIPRRRRDSVNAGFLLPTVAMVSIVVVLLTAAILFRSFERSKNASNVRVNEVVIKAASPALDRAKAKINQLFQDPRLPRSTPTDFSLSQVINGNISQYTFGDETQLELVTTTPVTQTQQTIQTAWKYPVDTNNNGKFDSYTLYGIYFLTPTTVRPRSSVEARTIPMAQGAISSTQCTSSTTTSADLVGSQGWYQVNGQLERSIFVYTTTVPITNITTPALDTTKYETLTSNQGFAALEYQQDRTRIPLTNNAVIFDNDLEITPGAGLNLNGRVFTNANLLTRAGGTIRYYLVSSPASCYYTQVNSKIVVAGNVINSRVNETGAGSDVTVDLFDQSYNAATLSGVSSGAINDTNKTVPQAVYGNTAAYNDQAYVTRIQCLISATNSAYPNTTDLPDTVQQSITSDLAVNSTLNPATARNNELQLYFQQRTRRIPYAEVAFGGDPIGTSYSCTSGSSSPLPLQRENSNALRPIDAWVYPFNPADGITSTGYAKIGIYPHGTNKMYLTATDPAQQANANKENVIGDRVLVGNNMPQYWYNTTLKAFVSSPTTGQTITGYQWDYQQNGKTNSTVTRQRYSQASQLDNLGVTDRDNFWELSAAQQPTGPLDVVGGLRVVTGAGIYLPNGLTTTSTSAQLTAANAQTTVWPDSMAMGVQKVMGANDPKSGLPSSGTPYLQMRATAVYHYQNSSYNPLTPATYQTPIACVASYYDPTNSTTAQNQTTDFGGNSLAGLTGLSNVDPASPTSGGNSLNGIVYAPPSLSGVQTYTAALKYQASLTYPNGLPVNLPLQNALANQANNVSLTLSQQSAIDSAVCALQILDGTVGQPTNSTIPHGAIRETSFLDARQVKAIDKPLTASQSNYDLDIELRQPLEIRATVLDLNLLRKTATSTAKNEFLLPNSGIIYATRDDALPDLSNTNGLSKTAALSNTGALTASATDLVLDPNRRPNGIMLINGSDLSRYTTYNASEKGLILASNLPVYIQGNFNQHTQQEFTQSNTWGTQFYQRTTLNPDFACRAGQFTTCQNGETWRPATVIADAITVLSSNFRLGYRNEGDYNLRDNYGSYALGYDVNGDGTINPATTVSLNEGNLTFDLNNDGTINSATNVSYTENLIPGTVAARLNGFWDNNFVTSRSFTDSSYSGTASGYQGSSYFNNFVTPVQRRIKFSEYLMEICPKRTVTACNPTDWVVGYDLNGNQSFGDTVTINNNTYIENKIQANQLLQALVDAKVNNLNFTFNKTSLWSGTTVLPAAPDKNDPLYNNTNTPQLNQSYPRRVAFLRYGNGLTVTKVLNGILTALNISPTTNALVLDLDGTPIPLGMSNGLLKYLPFSSILTINGTLSPIIQPDVSTNALWFQTKGKTYTPSQPLNILNSLTGTRATEQPLLAPVLQIQYPLATSSGNSISSSDGKASNWLQSAVATETNVSFAQGNTPERPPVTNQIGEYNGGLENFIRYLEAWNSAISHQASGSFIQFKRSSYATAPFQTLINSATATGTIFGYPQAYTQSNNNYIVSPQGNAPFYTPPVRNWGYDVALLTQLPDLFSQRFTSPSVGSPNEFYREVSRDDSWVHTLLCAAQPTTVPGGYDNAATAYNVTTPTAINYKYAISSDQRPASCP